MAEADTMRFLQIAASKLGARLFRQNTGLAWVGKVTRIYSNCTMRLSKGDVVIKSARPFHAGHTGMSDLGGWVPVVVTPEMVGSTVALYAQAEIKTDTGRPTEEQIAWIDAVNAAGGRAGIARNETDLEKILFG